MHEIFNEFLYFWDKNIVGSKTYQIIILSIDLIGNVWTFLLLGVLFTTILYYILPKHRIVKYFKAHSKSSILIAALIGILSPFGLRSLIPLVAALLFIGIPLPPLIAFMISSPLINPNLFILTAGTLGSEFAVLRLIAAFTLGIIGGLIVKIFNRFDLLKHDEVVLEKHKHRFNLGKRSLPPTFIGKVRTILDEYLRFLKFVGKYFLIAVVLAATIKTFLPTGIIYKIFGENDYSSVILSTFVGVPLYICGGAAIPMVQQLFTLGMSRGAVLAFFIAGPATKISSLILMKSVLKTSLLITYLIVIFGGSIIFGIICNIY